MIENSLFFGRLTRGETGLFFLSGFVVMLYTGTTAGWAKALLRSKYTEIELPHQGSQLEQICHATFFSFFSLFLIHCWLHNKNI